MAPAKLRTKTGCLTCRKRRVKCGEQKPSCHSCATHGRPCIWPTENELYDRRHCARPAGKRSCRTNSSSTAAAERDADSTPPSPVASSSMSVASRSNSVVSTVSNFSNFVAARSNSVSSTSMAAITSPSPSCAFSLHSFRPTSTPADDADTDLDDAVGCERTGYVDRIAGIAQGGHESSVVSPLRIKSFQPWTEYYSEVELELIHHFHVSYLPIMLLPTFPRKRLFEFGQYLSSLMIGSPGARMAVLAAAASNKYVLSGNARYQLQAIQYYSQAILFVNQTVNNLGVGGGQRTKTPDDALLLAVIFLYLYCLWGPYSTEEARQHVAGAMALIKMRYNDDRAPLCKDRAFDQVTVESVLYQSSLLLVQNVRAPENLLDTQFQKHSERFLYYNNEPRAKKKPTVPKTPASLEAGDSETATAEPFSRYPTLPSEPDRASEAAKRNQMSNHRTDLLEDSSMVLGAPLELYRLIDGLVRLQYAPEQITASILNKLKVEVEFWENVVAQFEEVAEEPGSPTSASPSSSPSSLSPSSFASPPSVPPLPRSAKRFYTDAVSLHTYAASLMHEQLTEYLTRSAITAPGSPTRERSPWSPFSSGIGDYDFETQLDMFPAFMPTDGDDTNQHKRSVPWQVSRALDLLRKPCTFEAWSRSYLGALPITIIGHAATKEDDRMLIRNFLTLTGHRTGFGLVSKIGGRLDEAWRNQSGATSSIGA